MAKCAWMGLGPSTDGEPALEAPVAASNVEEMAAMAVEFVARAAVGGAATVEVGTTAAKVVAVAAEAGTTSGEAVEVGPAVVEVMAVVTKVLTGGDAAEAEVATGVAGDDATEVEAAVVGTVAAETETGLPAMVLQRPG